MAVMSTGSCFCSIRFSLPVVTLFMAYELDNSIAAQISLLLCLLSIL